MRTLTLPLTLAALSAGFAVHAQTDAGAAAAQAPAVVTAIDVEALIIDKGYVAPFDLEKRHGLWTAEATTLEGKRVELLVDVPTESVTAFGDSARPGLSATEIQTRLTTAGYSNIRDLEFDDGFWEADATNAGGKKVELVIHPLTGAVLSERIDGEPPANSGLLSADQIRAALTTAGYTNIRDLEFDKGVWEADATNARGQRVELVIDARTGAVIREERD